MPKKLKDIKKNNGYATKYRYHSLCILITVRHVGSNDIILAGKAGILRINTISIHFIWKALNKPFWEN